MKLNKAAKLLDKDTQHELVSTGIIGAAGAATSALTHKLMSSGLVKNTAGKAALLGGGLGLLGDYAAVKINKKLGQSGPGSKHMDKQATFNALMNSGVNYDLAVALVKQASSDETTRGWLSPAWMENHIAAKHGKKGPEGVAANLGSHLSGSFRAAGRGLVEGAVGAGAGAGLGALATKALGKNTGLGAVAGGLAGYYGGLLHGTHKSLGNQAKEMHKKYSD